MIQTECSVWAQVNARLLAQAQDSHGAGGALQLDLDEHGRPGYPKVKRDHCKTSWNAGAPYRRNTVSTCTSVRRSWYSTPLPPCVYALSFVDTAPYRIPHANPHDPQACCCADSLEWP